MGFLRAAPLNFLLKKDAVFQWDDGCQSAFDQLKECLISAPVLAYPQFKSDVPFVLETDASIHGLGAVLAQKQADGKVHPIAYASRSLNCHERNYGITELETLGLVWAARLFRPYLLGHKCIVYTDHSACTSLLNTKHPSAKLARWALIIQELDLEIKHRPGKSNTNADALSRNPPSVLAVSATAVSGGTPSDQDSDNTPVNELSVRQREDPEFKDLFCYLEDGVLPEDNLQARRLVLERQRYAIVDGVLQYENPDLPGVWRIAVPQSMRETLLKEAHSKNFAGHFAERKVYATLRKKYWWNKMRADVRRHCRACLVCATRKGPGRRARPPLQPIPIGGPFHRVGVDVLKLPLTYDGNAYAVVFMDYFTKWPEVFAVPDQQATTIARLLVEEVVARHGVPEQLLSDRGSNFLSELICEVCKLLGIEKVNTSGYHPQTDGMVEKFNGTLTNMLSKCVQKHGRDWDKQLPYLLFAYRVAVQESTQDSPYFLLYGRDARTPTETALSQPRTPYQVDLADYKMEMVANLSEAWALAHGHIDRAQQKQKQQYDKKSQEIKWKVGDRVMVHMPGTIKGKAWKFARAFYGPYRVLTITPTNAEVRLVDKPEERSIFVALDRLRTCPGEMNDVSWSGYGQKRKPTPPKANSKPKPFATSPQPYSGPMTRARTRAALS